MGKMKNLVVAGGILSMGALAVWAATKPKGYPSPYKAIIYDEVCEKRKYYEEHPAEEISEDDKWLFEELKKIEADDNKRIKKAFYKSMLLKHPIYAINSMIKDLTWKQPKKE